MGRRPVVLSFDPVWNRAMIRFTGARLGAALLALIAMTIPASAQGDPERGEDVFKRCIACHDVGEGAQAKVGPPLNDIVGAQAASQPDYDFSDALTQAGDDGLTWTRETLHPYLEDPKQFVPGGKMQFPGLADEGDRDDVIAYLEQFS